MGAHLAAQLENIMSEALSLSDFAAQLSAAETPTGQAQEAPEGDAQEVAQIEDDTTEGQTQDGEQSQDGEGQEEADSEDGQAEAAPNEEMVIKWTTASGETHEAPLKELKDGYLRQSDYTQKTQQLSQERERAQQQVLNAYHQAQTLGPDLGRFQAIQAQVAQYQQLDWNAIQAADPQQHNTLANQFLILREQGKELQQSIQVRAQGLESLKLQEAQEAVSAAAEHLKKNVKGFGDKHLDAMNSHMLGKGLKNEDLPELVKRLGKQYAPAVLEAIHEAAQWKTLQSKKPEIDNRAKAIPPKPAARAQSAKPTSQQEQLAKVASSNKTMDAKTFASLLAQTRRK